MWCKKIGGELRYFGHAGCTQEEAQSHLIDFIGSAKAADGDEPPPALTIAELATGYAKDREPVLGRTTWTQYDAAIREFVKLVGGSLLASNVNAGHFEKVARVWRNRLAGNPFNNRIQSIRTMFKWAFERQLLDRAPHYGPAFKKIPAGEIRMSRLASGKTDRVFRSEEIQAILKVAAEPHRTFFLLGLNGGMYAADIADLTWSAIRNVEGVTLVDTTRYKSGIIRRFPIWPEVVVSISKMRRGSPDGRVFVTPHGKPWHNKRGTDSISRYFRRLGERINNRRPGVGFGSVRHTHISAVGDHPDSAAKRYVAGHMIEGIEHHYDLPSVARCKAVTDLARVRLLSIEAPTAASLKAGIAKSSPRKRGGSRRASSPA